MDKKDLDSFMDLIISILIGILVCLLISVLIGSSIIVKADTVSGNELSISGNTVPAFEQNVVSSNYVSGNTLSGPMTYDQGDRCIFLLSMILFMLVLSFCYERIRNGIRSTKHTH